MLSSDEAQISKVFFHDSAHDAFTHAPPLTDRWWLAGWQILGWLFFHPSAWQNYVAHISPDLGPRFCLADLSLADWQNPYLQRLLAVIGLGPFASSIVICLTLWLFDIVDPAIFFGLAAGLASGLMFMITVSLATGLGVGLSTGLAFSLVYGQPDLLAVDIVTGVTFGVIFGLNAGVAGHIATNTGQRSLTHTLSWQAAGVAIGLLISGLVVLLAVGAVLFGFIILGLKDNVGGAAAVALGGGLGLGIIFTVTIWQQTRRWQTGVGGGVVTGAATGLIIRVYSQ